MVVMYVLHNICIQIVSGLDINFFGYLSCKTSHTKNKLLVRQLASLALVGMLLAADFQMST